MRMGRRARCMRPSTSHAWQVRSTVLPHGGDDTRVTREELTIAAQADFTVRSERETPTDLLPEFLLLQQRRQVAHGSLISHQPEPSTSKLPFFLEQHI